MSWLRRFFAIWAYLRRVRKFNRTTKGTRFATNWKSAVAIYDEGGREALAQIFAKMVDHGKREEELLM